MQLVGKDMQGMENIMVGTDTRRSVTDNMRIGQKLLQCLSDIANGKVRIEEVAYVLAAVPYRDLAHMLESVAAWRVGRVDRHLEIARELWESGRIFLPSVTIDNVTGPNWRMVGARPGEVVPMSYARHGSDRLSEGLRNVTLSDDQRSAYNMMLTGASATIVGAPQSGRSIVAALAAMAWTSNHVTYQGKALVVCRDGRTAMQMRNYGVENVLTYEEIDEFDASEALATLGRYRLFIFDDYEPVRAKAADMCIDSGLLSPSIKLPVVRLADIGSALDRDADVALATRMRAA